MSPNNKNEDDIKNLPGEKSIENVEGKQYSNL